MALCKIVLVEVDDFSTNTIFNLGSLSTVVG